MDWQQKLAALKALTETRVEMRSPGDWYVHACARSFEEGTMLRGSYGNGKTPEEAVIDDWNQVNSGAVIVLHGSSIKCRRVRWNGFMWEDLQP